MKSTLFVLFSLFEKARLHYMNTNTYSNLQYKVKLYKNICNTANLQNSDVRLSYFYSPWQMQQAFYN